MKDSCSILKAPMKRFTTANFCSLRVINFFDFNNSSGLIWKSSFQSITKLCPEGQVDAIQPTHYHHHCHPKICGEMWQVVREKVFQRMHKELPYTIRLRHELTRILADNSVRLEYELLVPHEGVRHLPLPLSCHPNKYHTSINLSIDDDHGHQTRHD